MNGKNDELQSGRLAIRLQKIFTVIYSNAMDSIEPRDMHDSDYKEKHDAWEKAFAFKDELKNYIDSLSSMISDAGQTHSSNDPIRVGEDFVIKLRNVLDSSEFQKNMNIAKPNTTDCELLRIWHNAFTFPTMLQNFANSVEHILAPSGGNMSFFTFLSMLNSFLNGVENDLKLPHTS